MSLIFLPWFLQIVSVCYATCEECVVIRLDLFEDKLVTEDQLWSLKAPNQVICYRLCYTDILCVSFQYNPVSELCRGSSAAFTILSDTVNEIGNNLYQTCKGENQYGAACRAQSDCHGENITCIGGVCKCQAYYKYSSKTGSCYQYFFGCYEDKWDLRMLPYARMEVDDMAVDMCVTHCRDRGYAFAGNQNGRICWCGNDILSGYQKYDKGPCTYQCSGNNTQFCGSWYRNSIYNSSSKNYFGCYEDKENPRMLPYARKEADDMTIDVCATHCRDRGYAFAGNQFGRICWCGNEILSGYWKYEDIIGLCDYLCPGNNKQLCGGFYKNSIYSTRQ